MKCIGCGKPYEGNEALAEEMKVDDFWIVWPICEFNFSATDEGTVNLACEECVTNHRVQVCYAKAEVNDTFWVRRDHMVIVSFSDGWIKAVVVDVKPDNRVEIEWMEKGPHLPTVVFAKTDIRRLMTKGVYGQEQPYTYPYKDLTHYFTRGCNINLHLDSVAARGPGLPLTLISQLQEFLDQQADALNRLYGYERTIELIDPSMYCFIAGESRLRNDQLAQVAPSPSAHNSLQWLPTEVEITSDNNVKIMSYINGLPYEEECPLVYEMLEQLLQRSLPQMQECLQGGWLQKEARPKLTNTRIQVIIRAADTTKDGEWQMDGLPHEHLLLTVAYWFGEKKTIAFRRHLTRKEELNLPFTQSIPPPFAFEEKMLSLGQLEVSSGSCVVYPAHYQHQEQRSSSRKLLFYIVDPNYQSYSTGTIQDLRRSYLFRLAADELQRFSLQTFHGILPQVILMMILEYAFPGITTAEALIYHQRSCDMRSKWTKRCVSS